MICKVLRMKFPPWLGFPLGKGRALGQHRSNSPILDANSLIVNVRVAEQGRIAPSRAGLRKPSPPLTIVTFETIWRHAAFHIYTFHCMATGMVSR